MKRIDFEGTVHEFPDDFSDAEIAAALGGRQQGITERAGKAVADVIVPRDPTQPMLHERAWETVKGAPAAMWENLKTPTGAGSTLGTLLPTILGLVPHPATKALGMAANTPAGRTLGAGLGAAGGALIEDADPLRAGAEAMGWTALGEGVMGLGAKGARSLPSVKGRIAEGQARGMAGAIRQVSPELADTMEGARAGLAPTLKGGKTAAAMQETALGEGGQSALSAAMERGMAQVDALAPGVTVIGPSLLDAYAAMPQLARDRLIGPVATGGFTPRQAQEVISWVGSKAFSEAPLGQGVGKVPQQKLWADALHETVGGLPPDAADVFVQIRAPYAGGQMYLDMLRSGTTEGPFRGYPNQLMLDENLARRYISENRMELVNKLGPQGFQALLDSLGGAQPGTKSLLTPGAGGPFDALMATLGRGTNTGTMSLPSGALRMPFPNVGSRYAGRAPYTLPPQLQAILDVVMQRAGGAALGDQR